MKEKHISVDEKLHERVKVVAKDSNRTIRGWVEQKVKEDESHTKAKS